MGGAALSAVARLSTDRAHSVLLAALLLAVALLLLSCVASPCFLRPKRGDNVSCASLNRFFLLPIVSIIATTLAFVLWRSESIGTTLALWLAFGVPLATLAWVLVLIAFHVVAVGEIRCLERDEPEPPRRGQPLAQQPPAVP